MNAKDIRQYAADQTVTVNGVTLHYAAAGEGRPVVLIHGNGEDHSIFGVEMEQLISAGYRVYAPDSRGHGANAPMAEYHYREMAEDVYEFIKALKLEKPALYGHSDGGIIGLLLGTAFVFHQIGSFISTWLGGVLGANGQYLLLWVTGAVLATAAALLCYTIKEPAE